MKKKNSILDIDFCNYGYELQNKLAIEKQLVIFKTIIN